MIHLISPFPISAYPQAWKWLQEFPKANFDDYGPKNYVEFVQEMTRRDQHERTWGVVKDYEVCGIVGYCPLTPRAGSFHGICFPLGKLSRGEKFEALQLILKDLWKTGVDKISASFFADNHKIYKFLKDLGAVDEGYLSKQTLRHGIPTDMKLVAIFKEN